MLKLNRPLLWFDVETTGLSKTARICQIAVERFLPGDDKGVPYWTLVNPGIPIPKGASEKHRIWDNDVLLQPRFEAIAPKLIRAFEGCDFGGYNVRFDIEVVLREFKRVGVDTSKVDPNAMKLDGLRLWQVLEPRTLTDFVKRFLNRDHAGAHDAAADIAVTRLGVMEVLKLAPFVGLTLEELDALQWPKDPDAITADGKVKWNGDVPVMTFGKHIDEPLQRVPSSYLNYLLKQDFAPETMRIFADAVRGIFPRKD